MKKTLLPLVLLTSLLAPLLQCSEAGITVAVNLLHHYRKGPDGVYPPGQGDGAPRSFKTDLGYQITLTRGYATIGSVEIVPCPAMSLRLRDALLSRAHAHSAASATRLGTPHVESLLRADFSPLSIGVLAPPPGAYCSLRVAVDQADSDAEGLPAEVSMVGKSVYLEGSYVPPAGGAAVAFTLVSLARQTATVALTDQAGQAAARTLDAASAAQQLNVGLSYDGWLDGVDFLTMGAEAQAAKLADNVLKAIHHHPAPVDGGDAHGH